MDYLNGAAYVNLPPPDAIQEFKVQTSNFSAEFGRAGGVVLNASIKSGTNQLHGSAWEFLRNDKLDPADLYFVDRSKISKGALRQNQFGASAGGPAIKNKTFIFGDYDGRRIRQSALHNPTVPTDLQRNSGFTDFRDVLAEVGGLPKKDLLGRSSTVSLDPRNADAFLQLGILYANQHKYNDAITQYEQAFKLNRDNAAIHYRLGQALIHTGAAERARQEFAEFERLHAREVEEQRSKLPTSSSLFIPCAIQLLLAKSSVRNIWNR